MRVVEVTAVGGPEGLKVAERPDPVPQAGQVVVDVEAAGVGLADVLIRRGAARGVGAGFVPGMEVAGTVTSLGPEVDPSWSGRRVLAITAAGGGYADRALAPAAALAALPDDVAATDAVALGINALVAEASLDRATVRAGDRVLVRGAGGGIGVMTVQLAALRGATVVASVTDPVRAARLRALGAAEVVGPRPDEDGPSEPCQAIIDVVAGPDLPSFVPLLAPNGRYIICGISAGPPPADFGMTLFGDFQKSWTISALSLTSGWLDAPAAALEKVVDAGRSGALRAIVQTVHRLEDAAAAHEELERGGIFGKIVLVPGPVTGR